MLHNCSRQIVGTSSPLYGAPTLPAALLTTAMMIWAQPLPKIGSGTLRHWHSSQIARLAYGSVGHWIRHQISHPPTRCLHLKKNSTGPKNNIVHSGTAS